MCGRYALTANTEAIQQAFPEFKMPDMHIPRYNIAPSQPVLSIPNDGKNQMTFFKWGLVPSWSKDVKIGYKMINARGETVAEKPSFRTAFKRRRCLILTDGFFEWRKDPGGKTPMFIQMKSGNPFALAGLWEVWRSPEGDELRTCTIITTPPNELLKPIHNRMPVIIPPDAYTDWLDPVERPADTLQHHIQTYPAELMRAYPVSTVVNSPANDVPACVEPVG